MEIILTLELVRVFGLILHLDCSVEELVLSAHQIGHVVKCLKRVLRHDVAAHGMLASADGPQMEVVKLLNISHLNNIIL